MEMRSDFVLIVLIVGGIFAAVAVFAVFIIVLLLRPEGLAGAAAAIKLSGMPVAFVIVLLAAWAPPAQSAGESG